MGRIAMTREGLPDDVVQLLIDRVASVPHLEALLLMWRSAPASWTPEALAARVYVPVSKAAEILADLQREGMVRLLESGAFTYAPDWDRDQPIMARVDESYRTNLIGVSELLHAKGSNAVREFARAFRLKRDDK